MTLNDVIRKIRKESFASSLYATDGCNTVKFVTDNQNEYFAVAVSYTHLDVYKRQGK